MSIVMKDGERLYLRSWEYNAARIISELAKIIKDNGGRVKPTNKALISKLNVDNDIPIVVTHTTYISFIIGDLYYYYQMNENPYFDFYYQKTPIKNGEYSHNACLMNDNKNWSIGLNAYGDNEQCEISNTANKLYNMLLAAPLSYLMHGRENEVERFIKIEF